MRGDEASEKIKVEYSCIGAGGMSIFLIDESLSLEYAESFIPPAKQIGRLLQ